MKMERALSRQSVRALIIKEGCVLIVLHVDSGQWILPGGGVELDETCDQALPREVLEELRVRLLAWEHLSSYYKPEKNAQDEIYLATACSGQICLDEREHRGYLWATREDLDRVDIRPRHRAYAEQGFATRRETVWE